MIIAQDHAAPSINPPIHQSIDPSGSAPQSVGHSPSPSTPSLHHSIQCAILSQFPQIIKLAASLTTCGLGTSKARTQKTSKFQFWRRNPLLPPATPLNPPELDFSSTHTPIPPMGHFVPPPPPSALHCPFPNVQCSMFSVRCSMFNAILHLPSSILSPPPPSALPKYQ